MLTNVGPNEWNEENKPLYEMDVDTGEVKTAEQEGQRRGYR